MAVFREMLWHSAGTTDGTSVTTTWWLHPVLSSMAVDIPAKLV